MGRQPVRCTSCASTWAGRHARFCGRCGAPLTGADDLTLDPAAGAAHRDRFRRFAILAVVVGIAVLVIGVAVTDVLEQQRVDPQVTLPSADALPGSRLPPDEAAELRRQVSPRLLRCEPRGCEVWRHERASVSAIVTVGANLVVVLEDGRMVGLDGRTGDERWVDPLDDVVHGGEGRLGGGAGGDWWPLLVSVDDGVVAGLPGHLILVDEVGTRRWTTPTRPFQFWTVEETDGPLLLHGDGPHGSAVLLAIDPADGRILWERERTSTSSFVTDGLVVVADLRRVEVVDLADGEPLWVHDFDPEGSRSGWDTPDVWLAGDPPVVVAASGAGEMVGLDLIDGHQLWARTYDRDHWPLVAEAWAAIAEPDSPDVALVEVTTGRTVVTFHDAVVDGWTQEDDLWVLLILPGDRRTMLDQSDEQGARLVAIDGSGVVVWEHVAESARSCCPWLSTDGSGGVALQTDDPSDGTRELLRIRVATGEPLEIREHGSQDAVHRWEADDGTWIDWLPEVVELRDGDRGARIFPGDAWSTAKAPWVFGTDTELMGVRLVPDG